MTLPAGRRLSAAYAVPAAAGTTGVLVGATLVATRAVIHDASPTSLAFLRYLVGVACLLPLLVITRPVRIAPRDLLPVALLGIAQFGVLIVLLNWSLLFISAARAALLFATMPLMTLLLAVALRRERPTTVRTLGTLLTIGGVAAVLGEQALRPGAGERAWLGEGAALASALTGALCSVLYRPYLDRYRTLPVSAVAVAASVVVLGALAAGEGSFARAPSFSVGGWLVVLFIGASSAVGYLAWLWALGRAAPTNVAVFLALGPLTAALLGGLLLDESINLALLLGIALVAAGLWLAHRPEPREHQAARTRDGTVPASPESADRTAQRRG